MVKRIRLRSALVLSLLVAAALLCGWKLIGFPGKQTKATELDGALLAAIRNSDHATVQRLIDRGADVNARGESGSTALMEAALNADPGTLEVLLARGADPRVRNQDGCTALLRAVHDLDKVKLLLAHGAPVGDEEVVLAALVPESAETVRLLLGHGGSANANVGGFTALMAAAGAGDLDTVHYLIDQGADVSRKRADGYTALHAAALSGDASVVKLLLDRGAEPNVSYEITNPTYDLQTPATLAAWLGFDQILKQLLDKGADVNTQGGSFERTALLYAATTGNEDSMRLLLGRGADVNARDWAGHTPLWWAKRRGKTPIVKLLEQAGAVDPALPRVARPESSEPRPIGSGATPLPIGRGSEDSERATPRDSVQRAVTAALPVLQQTGPKFFSRKGCVSCHHQALVAVTVSLARARGFSVDEKTAALERDHVLAHLGESREKLLRGHGTDPALVPWALWGLGAEGQEPNALTDALVHYLVVHQKKAGNWQTRVNRPPHDASHFTFTALAVKGLQLYARKGRSEEVRCRIRRARDWLMRTPAPETEDETFRLLGLRWTEAGKEPVDEAVARLLREQREDGGWAQLPTLPSDAYATGEVLYALHEGGGIPVSQPAYQRGVAFLLRTQLADGTWMVPTRSFPIIEAFNSGFPHGRSQFISTAGTCWATIALTLCVPGKDDYPSQGTGYPLYKRGQEPTERQAAQVAKPEP
jgi:ankyrin repeat protein